MNIRHHDQPQGAPRAEPLDAEERALAQRLVRIAPKGQPSPELDAHILAAARTALDADARPRRSHWPLALGLAASLVLAVGVAWQLRPLPDAIPVYDERPAATQAAQGELAHDALEADAETTPATPQAEPARAARAVTPRSNDDAAEPATHPSPPREVQAPPKAEPVPAPPVVFDAPSPVDDAAPAAARLPPPPPPPPAPAPRPPAQPRAFPQEAEVAVPSKSVTAERTARQDAATIPPAAGARQPQEAAAQAIQAAPAGDSFPDTAQGRAAWLRHVRTLRDAGRVQEARTALRAFRDRYPDYPLAEDLQALLAQ